MVYLLVVATQSPYWGVSSNLTSPTTRGIVVIGSRFRLKICWRYLRMGSSPVSPTKGYCTLKQFYVEVLREPVKNRNTLVWRNWQRN